MTMLQKVSLRGNNSEGHLAGAIPRLVKRKGGGIMSEPLLAHGKRVGSD